MHKMTNAGKSRGQTRFPLVAVFAFVAIGLNAEIVYRNDFTTRASAKPVPAVGGWSRYDYTDGNPLAHSYGTTVLNYTENLPWSQPAKMQDGWMQGGYGTWFPVAIVTNNVGSATERPFAALDVNSTSNYKGLLYQPVGNSFTNGTLTCWIDMRAPVSWGMSGVTPMLRFFPAYRTFLENPDGLSNAPEYPAVCGIQRAASVRFFGFANVAGGQSSLKSAFYDQPDIGVGKWCRFRLTVDIDNKTTSCSVWKLGSTVPAWDEAVTDEGLHQDGKYFYRYPTDETGPIEGIGFYAEGVKSRGNVADMPAFTNIRLEWQAPGASSSVPCYSNNFVTCWKRRVTPGTVANIYAAASLHSVTNTYKPEVVGHMTFNNGSPMLTPAPSNTRTVGVDGWKRCDNNGGLVYACGTTALANTNFLKMCYRNKVASESSFQYAVVSQTLGEKVVSGKVRLSVDGRTPSQWSWGNNRFLYVALGSDYLYSSATTANYSDYVAARIGVTSAGLASNPYPIYCDSDGVQSVTTTNVEFLTWQRYVITVDLDNKKYDWAIYDIDPGPADRPEPETPVASGSGVSFSKSVSDVGSFVLYGYGFSTDNTFNKHILFDNIRVWKNWDDSTQTGELIYYNDFEERRRVVSTDTRPLAGKSNLARPDRDCWVRRGSCDGTAEIAGSLNPAVALADGGENVVFHDLGTHWSASSARQMTVSVDVRPPNFWYGTGSKRAMVVIGSENAAQGDSFGGADPLAKAAIRFGFEPSGAAGDACGRYASTVACAVNGNSDETADFAVSSSNWYRFVVKTCPRDGTYDLDIYQQGSHPDATAPNGTLVASLKGLSYANGSDRDLSAIGLASGGTRGFTPWLAEDAGWVMFDNVTVDRAPVGMVISIK